MKPHYEGRFFRDPADLIKDGATFIAVFIVLYIAVFSDLGFH